MVALELYPSRNTCPYMCFACCLGKPQLEPHLVLCVFWVCMDANPRFTYGNKESQSTWCLINSAQYWFLLVS